MPQRMQMPPMPGLQSTCEGIISRKAREGDAVGCEHYCVTSRSYNGIDLNLNETYEWGWDQLRWVQSEMRKAADQIKPGASIDEAVEILESDSERAIEGVDEFREWMQGLQDSTINGYGWDAFRHCGAGEDD